MTAVRITIAAFILSLLSAAAPPPVAAQINITIGGNPAKIKRALQQQGYSRIEFTGRGFTKFRARACKDGKLWKFKVDARGKTNDRKIVGNCRTRIDANAVSQRLAQAGYRRINIEEQNGEYVAIACSQGYRFRVNVDFYGEILRERRIGECFRELTPTDIEAQLKQAGYSRFNWINRQPPRYIAEACRQNVKYELVINAGGVIRDQRPIGQCQRAIAPTQIQQVLGALGYTRVEVVDDKLPRYGAIACRDDLKLEVVLNQFGKVIDRKELGRCFSPMDGNEIIALVKKQGFTRVSLLSENSKGFRINGCYNERRYHFDLTAYGELRDEKDIGACESQSVFEMIDGFTENGFENSQLFIEACSRGKKVRIQLNEFGEQSGRQILGPCHKLDGVYKN